MFFIVASFVLLFMSMLVARVLINKDKFIRIGLIIFATMYMAVVARVSIVIIGKKHLTDCLCMGWIYCNRCC